MKLLLDTHIFIWWADEPEKLSTDALSALEGETNELLLSKELIENQQEINSLQILPVELSHVLALDTLPFHHKDPFDRLLIAQSLVEDVTLVTADDKFSAYSAKLLR